MIYRVDYYADARAYVDLRDLDALLTALDSNAKINTDHKTIELIKVIIASFIKTLEVGAIEDSCLKISDEQIYQLLKDATKTASKDNRILSRQIRKDKKAAIKKAKANPISPHLKVIDPYENEEEEEPEAEEETAEEPETSEATEEEPIDEPEAEKALKNETEG